MAILEMKHITKSFGGSHALKDGNLTVEAGEIHALLGENGAGKSTLMNILTGVLSADSGSVRFLDREYPNPTIPQMEAAGIAFVHQELNVINDLTVADNIFLRRELTRFGLLRKREQIARSKKLFEDLGVDIDPTVPVSSLKTSEKQLLEICRALYMDAKLLILDEPTTALSNDEIDHLFEILRRLKAQGKSFIFISHKMPEIFAISDRYTVMRNGSYICSGKIAETNPHEITSAMVGAEFVDTELYTPRKLGEDYLTLEHFSGQGFRDVDLTVKKGEILAFNGLAGCGASELMQTMFGALPIQGGVMRVGGKPVRGGILSFMKRSVGMLPAHRRDHSVVADLSILENFYLAEHRLSKRRPFIRRKAEEARYQKQKQALRIKAGASSDGILSLSGGNQQKVFLGRWLNTGADILLLDNPTRGVDVGAKEEIYKLILDLAESGKTIILNTLEIPEIRKVADRCVVFYEGRIVKIFRHEEVNEHDVMLYATNAIHTSKEATS